MRNSIKNIYKKLGRNFLWNIDEGIVISIRKDIGPYFRNFSDMGLIVILYELTNDGKNPLRLGTFYNNEIERICVGDKLKVYYTKRHFYTTEEGDTYFTLKDAEVIFRNPAGLAAYSPGRAFSK